MTAAIVRPFILCGGSGSRLWPLSRPTHPKPFLSLVSENSLLQETALRVRHSRFAPPVILTTEDHRFLVAEQLRQIDIQPANVVLEPVRRNTAPAALVAALMTSENEPDRHILLLPCDHVINDVSRFHASMFEGIAASEQGHIVTFGVTPGYPEPGYGYIQAEETVTRIREVSQFVEKPPMELAQEFQEQQHFFWNAGIYLFQAQVLIDAFEQLAPDTLDKCRTALANAITEKDFLWLDREAYEGVESKSLDHAIIENSANTRTVPLLSDWRDIGTWPAVCAMHEKDEDGNVARGDVLLLDTNNSFVCSEDGLRLTVMGLDNLFAVATKEAIVVASTNRTQDVSTIAGELAEQDSASADVHHRHHRPWGWFERIAFGDRFQVKFLMVNPGASLSLQKHLHRMEHWVVVQGTLQVSVENDVTMLTENQSIYIPLGAQHRLVNPGRVPALIVEVQSGSYLGEDDIVRFEDEYNRGTPASSGKNVGLEGHEYNPGSTKT